ncbi:MAG TPA: acyl-CoA dehydrogenase family protein, partial [Acidimicrobiales bacterium]|nr:acyl-CoA dehydrogenase family protein [Acidimicrobiales bacterium]
MNLALTPQERSFQADIASWLDANVTPAPDFASFGDEFEWGRSWQAKLATDRWVGIHWPVEFGGRGATPVEVAIFNMEYARSRAPQPVNRTGLNLTGPTLLRHGTDAQRALWLPAILSAEEIWCQLFSEPGAGSDLASLSTRATEVEGGWVVDGQKVWTSFAQFARWGIALVRTDTDAPRHRGITCMAIDMTAPGVSVRPLMTMTMEAEFNEVFFDEVFVPSAHVIGGSNQGWAVANTTLAHERGTNFAFKEQVVHEVYLERVLGLAAAGGQLDDELTADQLADAYVKLRILRYHNWRMLTRLGAGIEPGPETSVTKLAWTDMTQQLSEVALAALGPAAPLWGGAEDNPDRGRWQRQWLWSKASSIAGGTSEIQKNLI